MAITRRGVRSILACTAALPLIAVAGCAGSGGGSEQGGDGGSKEIVYAVQAFAHEAIQPIIDEFTDETGIKVKLEGGPATGQDLLTQLVPAFTSGTTPYDVVDADDPAGAALVAGGWLEPLGDDATADYLADLSEGMKQSHEEWNVVDGESYRVYHNYELGYYWANEELLSEHGLEAPTTWAEIESVGAELKKDGIYAFADAAAKPGLTFVYLAYMAAQAGGNIYEADAGTKEAFEFAKKLVDEGYFPEDAITWNYDQSNAAYMEDKVATMRQWTFFDGVSQANTEWYSPEKAVIVDPPAGPAGSKTWAGGWGMSIPKASKHIEEAKQFVAWMNQPEIAARLAEASSFFISSRTSVLDAMGESGIVAALKHYSDSGFVVPRPFHPQAAQAEAIVDDIGQSYLTGQIDIDEAMQRLADEIAALG
jgi:ABC-type glycerol-3-phosphate transport system substrate-binding protein